MRPKNCTSRTVPVTLAVASKQRVAGSNPARRAHQTPRPAVYSACLWLIFTKHSGAFVPELRARWGRAPLVLTSLRELAQSISDGPLALISCVQVDHCGPDCRVTHSVHQVAQARPSARSQRVAGMA